MSIQFTKELTLAKPARNAGGASSIILGIDLGTTNSLVAVMDKGVPVVLKGPNGSGLVPSVISVVDGQVTVGAQAKQDKVLHADHTAFSIKRLLGRSFEDLKSSLQGLPYQVLPGEGDEAGMVRIRLGERIFNAVELSAMILKELKNLASKALGVEVHKAVVTVPAYFNDAQRQATRTAGRLAGLEIVRIINEPTAASLAYGIDKKKQGLIAVYDLGGGTFDVSILRLHDGIFEVLATAGDTQLGGDDLDRVILDQSVSDLQELWKIDGRTDRKLLATLLEEAERVKKAFSTNDAESFKIQWQGRAYTREWTRTEFESRVRPLLLKTQTACVQALKDAGISTKEITDVVMVGGPTRLPIVQKIAQEIFGRAVNTSMHPDEVVAAGAAIQADVLAGNSSDLLLLDVVPLSLGIETYGGAMSVLIARNSRIPTSAKEMYTNFVDGQNAVELHVLQGEREEAAQNRSLAKFKLRGLEPLPAATHRIEVSFVIDADGILQVYARDQRTHKETSVEVRPTYGLTDAQVETMLEAGLNFAEEDFEFKKRVEARTEAEPVAVATEKSLKRAREFVTLGKLESSDVEKIEKRLKDLKIALEHGDSQQIREAKGLLDKATVRLAELVVKELV